MSFLSDSVKKNLTNDLVKNFSVLLVQNLLLKYATTGKIEFVDEAQLKAILFFLAGLTVYWVVVVNIVPQE